MQNVKRFGVICFIFLSAYLFQFNAYAQGEVDFQADDAFLTQPLPPELELPQNAHEARVFAKTVRELFVKATEAKGLDPYNKNPEINQTTLVITYNKPAAHIANNVYVHAVLEKLHRKGINVEIKRDDSTDEALQALDELSKNENLVDEVIAEINTRPDVKLKPEFKPLLKEKFKLAIDELKVFFGLRRGTNFMSFVRPFIDEKTGIRRPPLKILRTFACQFHLIVFAFFGALYGAMHDPSVIEHLGFKSDFWNFNHYLLFFKMRNAMIAAGHPLPVDPLYFAVGATMVRSFWAVFDPAADAILKMGRRFNVHTQRMEIPIWWQLFAQTILSSGDLFIVAFGYEFSRVHSGIKVAYRHLLLTTVPLVTMSGALVKNLPKNIIFRLQDAKIITDRGQDALNGIIGGILSYAKTIKVIRSGGPFDPYYWFAYVGVIFAAHNIALNKAEGYREIIRNVETKWKSTMNSIKKIHRVTGCLLKLKKQ